MMTEEDARKKWCPFARYVPTCAPSQPSVIAPQGRTIHFREDDGQMRMVEQHCVASNCAAWRWVWEFVGPIDCPGVQTDKGYCGLAGKP